MKNLIYIILFFITLSAKAQVLSYDFYSFRINNMFNVNPAYTGKNDGLNIVLSMQSQNKGVAHANKNFMLGMHSKISKKQAIGGRLISDTRGAFQLLKADLSYAFIAKITYESTFTMGLSAGILNNNLMINRIENFESLDQIDPTLTKSYYNTTQFTAGAGLLYTYKALEISVSLPHIIGTSQPLNGYVNGALFYSIKAGQKFKITPWVCYQNIPVTKNIVSAHVKTIYDDIIWVQVGYQTNNTFNAMLGINIENVSIGYGYKLSNKEFNTVATGSHEVTLAYRIPKIKRQATSSLNDNSSLNDIVNRLNTILKEPVTSKNKESVKIELAKIKILLQKAEIDNSTPEKAQGVSNQLLQIDEKLKLIEQKLLNEK